MLPSALALFALVLGGCAGLRCPRIDPSGERLFIWPRDQVTPVAASANPTVPPAFTDPVFPPAPVASASTPVGGLVPPLPQDRLTITPGRVLAPVGSEVILKAGLCTRENFLLTDSKVEWLVARDDAGEFVELGGRGWCKDPWLPWNRPQKIDNQYATGYTARVPLTITRGTAASTDDVQIEPGEAWASVTSPVEGVSRITAVAPEIEEWANRRATATIYWVDVQWTFPPTTISAGGAQVLTTTVLRQTDGTPVEGWLVRYEVADGGGSLRGDQSGQVVEVPTDANGRASIDVTPTGSAGSTTRINTQIVRPPRFGGTDTPRLEIASGSTTINWTDGGGDYVPPPDDLGTPLPPSTFPGGNSTAPIQPPTPAPARIGPRLEVQVFDTEPQEIRVGGSPRFEVVLRNTGDANASGIIVRNDFDPGLTHISDGRGENVIQTDPGKVADIGPGDSRSLFLTFGVQKAGRLCQNVRVSYNSPNAAMTNHCINVPQLQAQAQGQLQVSKQAPRLRNVGEIATFTLSIRNVGNAPLTNIEVVDTFDPELQPQPGDAELRNGSLFWRIQRLEVGGTWRRDVNCQCLAAKLEACGIVSVTAETGTLTPAVVTTERACTEIRQALPDVTPPVTPAPGGNVLPGVVPPTGGAGGTTSGGLLMEILSFANPVLAGTQTSFQIVIRNNTNTPDQQVQLRVLFPAELTPDVTAIRNEASVRAQFSNGELLFEPINTLRPGERIGFVIPCNVLQAGSRTVTAELISRNMPQSIQQTKEIEIIGR